MTFFKFEADFVDSLRCIPMVVRLKLDTCGVKLKLAEWNHFTQIECQQLVDRPCEQADEVSDYREYVSQLIWQHTGNAASLLSIDPQPPWLNDQEIPHSVATKTIQENVSIMLDQWAQLSPLQRFALIKLTRSQHENNNFLPALAEFGILSS